MVLKGVMDKKPQKPDCRKYAILSQPWILTFFEDEIFELWGMVGSSGARLGRETRSQTGAPILNNIFSAGPNFDPNPDITHFNMWSCEVVNTNTAQFKVAFLRSVTVSLHCSEMSKYPVLVTKWWPTIHHQSCCVGWGCVLCYYQIKRFQTTNTTNIYFSRENGWKIFPHFSILALPRCQSQPATFP